MSNPLQIGTPNYHPYGSQGEVAIRLGALVDEVAGRDAGLIWSDPAGSVVIRLPEFDADGYGVTVVARATGPVVPVADRPSSGIFQSIEKAFSDAFSGPKNPVPARYNARQYLANQAAGHMGPPFSDFVDAHPMIFDGMGSAFDIIGMIAGFSCFVAFLGGSLAVLPVLGAVGFIGCGWMLLADGHAFALEISGNKGKAENFHNSEFYQWTETIAPLLVIPDAAFHAPQEIEATGKEIGKISTEISKLKDETGKPILDLAMAQDQREALLAQQAANPATSPAAAIQQMQQLQKLNQDAQRFKDELAAIQKKIQHANGELHSKASMLRLSKAAAWGTGYSSFMYEVAPTNIVKDIPGGISDGFNFVEEQFCPRSSGPSQVVHHLAFHVAVSRRMR